MFTDDLWWPWLLIPLTYGLALLSCVDCLRNLRTAQGGTAWIIAMLSFPLLAVPLYWVFGHTRFTGYMQARRAGDRQADPYIEKLKARFPVNGQTLENYQERFRVLEALADLPFSQGNRTQLLIDGEATFKAMFAAIESAEDYILVQFFIFEDDRIGRAFRDRLMAKAQAGVRVYLLYDAIGCISIPEKYFQPIRDAGGEVYGFKTRRGPPLRFQINFRNHRKLLIIDGRVGFTGGLNVGDEYLGRDPSMTPWRDTHLQLKGPAVPCLQVSFIQDWYWAAHSIPDLNWQPEARDGRTVLVLPTGPADYLESCTLMFVHAIHAARHRLWIASPYLVPDREVITALQLAALRGVDVRLLVTGKADSWVVHLVSYAYDDQLLPMGIRLFRYRGFLHEKAMVVDDDLGMVGSANLDNRSFRLNFELNVLVADPAFTAEVAQMLEMDLANADEITNEDATRRSAAFKLATQGARLLAPLL